jgi:DNA repair protein RadC
MGTSNRHEAAERPRERLLASGPEPLSDAELLAVLFGTGVRGSDAVALSRTLLAERGGLHALFGSGARELGAASGLGPARIAKLKAALELGRRVLEGPRDRRRTLKRPQDAANCFRARLADLPHEVFSCLFLDTRHRIICFETLFRGTVDGATVYPREVLK